MNTKHLHFFCVFFFSLQIMSPALKSQTAARLTGSQHRQRKVLLIPLRKYSHPEKVSYVLKKTAKETGIIFNFV